MKIDVLTQVGDSAVTFVRRPTPIPGDLRPQWRVGLLLLLFDSCYGRTATPQQLHILDWVARDSHLHNDFSSMLHGERTVGDRFVRIDPALTRAVNFASACGLIARDGSTRTRRTELGVEIVAEISRDKELYTSERSFLSSLPRKLSSTMADRLFEVRRQS